MPMTQQMRKLRLRLRPELSQLELGTEHKSSALHLVFFPLYLLKGGLAEMLSFGGFKKKKILIF